MFEGQGGRKKLKEHQLYAGRYQSPKRVLKGHLIMFYLP